MVTVYTDLKFPNKIYIHFTCIILLILTLPPQLITQELLSSSLSEAICGVGRPLATFKIKSLNVAELLGGVGFYGFSATIY